MMAKAMLNQLPETNTDAEAAPDQNSVQNSALVIRGLNKRFGSETVLDGMSFSIAEGESLVLLGPSGSGKSTTLRLIAGLETPDGGDIFLHGRHIEHLRARERNIGVIFQNYALFPRMTVADNIAFGLKIRGKKKAERDGKVEELLAMIGMAEHRGKYPSQISGGQQQRVAIARALAYSPELLLFDESFSALDPQTRTGLRREIRGLLKRLKIPALFITHDQEEAMELGDQIAILNKGRMEQIGTPQQIYNDPQSEFVATFLGAANVVEVCRSDGFEALNCLQCLEAHQAQMPPSLERVKIIFRPEDVVLTSAPALAEHQRHLGHGVVVDVNFTGATEVVRVKLLSLNQFGYSTNANCQLVGENGCDLIIKVLRTKWDAQRMPLNAKEKVGIWLRDHKILSNYEN